MNHDPSDELDGLLREAVQELKASGSELPPDLNEHVLQQFPQPQIQPNSNPNDLYPRKKRGLNMFFFTRISSIAAGVALVIGLFFLSSSGDRNRLFAQAASRLAEIKALSCRVLMVEDAQVETANHEQGDKLTYVAPSLHRLDRSIGTVEIIDTKRSTMLMLNHDAQESLTVTGDMAQAMSVASPIRLIETVRTHFSPEKAGTNQVVKIESKEIDGIQAIGYRSTVGEQVLEAWCDPDRQLPLLVRVRFSLPDTAADGSDVTMWQVLTDFDYDTTPDPKLFDLTPPAGYRKLQMESPVIDQSPSGLDDLVALLKQCATVNDSQFPESLAMNDDEGTPMAIMKNSTSGLDAAFESATEAEQAEMMKQVTDFGSLLGRSQAFLLSLEKKNDLQYFGGAKLTDADRPVLWYSANGDDNYKIVYADLSVRDATKDSLPKKPVVPKRAAPRPVAPQGQTTN